MAAPTNKPDPQAMRAAMLPAILEQLRELKEAGTITRRQQAALDELEQRANPRRSPEEMLSTLYALEAKIDAGQGTELEKWRVGVFRQVMGRVRARST